MKAIKISGYFIGIFFILILWSGEKVEAKGFSSGSAISGVSGAGSPVNNSGTPSGNTKRSGRCGELTERLRLPEPEEDKKRRFGSRNKRGGRKKKKRGKKFGNKGKKKKIKLLRDSPAGFPSVKGVTKKKDSETRKAAEDFSGITEKEMIQVSENKTEVIRIERLDDIPLLISVMMQMELHKSLDRQIPSHWKQRNLSWGMTCIIWLAYILSEGDHRKVTVREYIKNLSVSLSMITGSEVEEYDFTDDRLGILLKHLSKKPCWDKIEKDISERSIEAYKLPVDTIRCDATTVSGNHAVEEDGLFQKGVSKDNPRLPQIKIMTGALDPLGMPLATDVVAGQNADDTLYVPVIKRMNEYLKNNDVLYVGDTKMSASGTRLYIKGLGEHYLCPLPHTGNIAQNMEKWVKIGIMKARQGALNDVYMEKNGEEKRVASGYEFERILSGESDGKKIKGMERVLIVNSPAHAKSQAAGLEKRLENAIKKLYALTPQRGPGKRQIADEKTLKDAINRILKQHKVEGMLFLKYEKEVENTEKYIGKGRGGKNRKKQTIEKIRYQVLSVRRNEYRIKREKERQGWKVFVTDVSPERLDFNGAVKCYRKEYRVERIFNRLKSRMNIAPLFVRKDDQIRGMTHLLTLGARVLTLMEYVVRRSLQENQAVLKGLYPENPKKTTDMPTSEKLLNAFSNINLTFLKMHGDITRCLTPLTSLQQEILKRLKLENFVYKNLEITKSPVILNKW